MIPFSIFNNGLEQDSTTAHFAGRLNWQPLLDRGEVLYRTNKDYPLTDSSLKQIFLDSLELKRVELTGYTRDAVDLASNFVNLYLRTISRIENGHDDVEYRETFMHPAGLTCVGLIAAATPEEFEPVLATVFKPVISYFPKKEQQLTKVKGGGKITPYSGPGHMYVDPYTGMMAFPEGILMHPRLRDPLMENIAEAVVKVRLPLSMLLGNIQTMLTCASGNLMAILPHFNYLITAPPIALLG